MASGSSLKFERQAQKIIQEAIESSNSYLKKQAKIQAIQDYLHKKSKKASVPLKKQIMLAVLKKFLTTPGRACELTGIGYEEHQAWKQQYRHYKRQLEVIQEMIKDLVEAKFIESAKNGSVKAQEAYLFSKAKERGYDKNRKATEDQKISKVEIIL